MSDPALAGDFARNFIQWTPAPAQARSFATPEPEACADGSGRGSPKALDAARQFEALLLEQILRSARESGSGADSAGGSSAECATEFAEQQFAVVLAKGGGLGIAKMIAAGLEQP